MRSILIFLVWFYSCTSLALPPHTFEDPAQQVRYSALLKIFRCVTCQNQTLSESNAPVAEAMREEIVHQIKAGQTDKEIEDYLVARYGDFVLFRPPLKKNTLILWLAPLLIGGSILGGMIWTILKRRS